MRSRGAQQSSKNSYDLGIIDFCRRSPACRGITTPMASRLVGTLPGDGSTAKMRKIALTFAILLSAFTVASAASAATKHRRAAQTNLPAYNAAAYGAGSGISYSTACLPTDSPCRTKPDDW